MKSGRKSERTGRKGVASANGSMLESLIHVWLAGLGAASKAQAKGPRWLHELIKEGARLEAFESNAAKKAVRSTLVGVRALARRVVNELPPVRVLKEVRALRKEVGAMNAKIDKLARARRPSSNPRRVTTPRSATNKV
jgi:hypothetical protein